MLKIPCMTQKGHKATAEEEKTIMTKFPMLEQTAEISFFGSIERETMEALQACTFAALQSNFDSQYQSTPTPVGFWRPSPYSPHVVHFVINLPGTWECRHTIQNILRVAWMDVFEHAGWTIVSMWNCNNSAAESPAQPAPGGVSEDSGGASADGSGGAAPSSSGGPVNPDLSEFKGECANFLLFKRASAGGGFQQINIPAIAAWPAGAASAVVMQPNVAPIGNIANASADAGISGSKRVAEDGSSGADGAQPPSKK